jgi:hypothetical protein
VEAIVVVRCPLNCDRGRLTATSDATRRTVRRRLRYAVVHIPQRKAYVLRVVRLCAMFSKLRFRAFPLRLSNRPFPLSLAPSLSPSMVFMSIPVPHSSSSDNFLQGPQEQSVGQITQFQKMFLAPGFLAYGSVLIAASLTIIFYFGPKYVCSSVFINKV